MNALNYIRSLAPVTERRNLLHVIDQLQLEYDDTLAPLVGDLRDALGNLPLKSMLARRLETTYRRTINFNVPVLQMVLNSLENVRGSFEQLRKEVRTLFSIQFTNSSLTFDRANLLIYVDALAFYIRYARKFMLFLVAAEARELGKATLAKWTPAENEWIDANMDQFAGLYPAMSMKSADFHDRLAKGSNAAIDESTFALAQQALAPNKIDPLTTNGFSPRQNPFLILGKMLGEMQMERYESAKQEYFGLQIRMQELRDLREGQPANPVLQKQIEAYERRVSSYEYDIGKLEERYGVK